ncbi:uncharacterized protein C6orf118-like [Salarias fasciatus]|uniref:uncharacterized protein C6orf118-like n=1 Tax=Salarias fasciatus TaxID=181472 RepID=UPI001176F93E|nr:uncharacterized protein C6orf118 homolog [Salarias fasciatus]
MSNRCKSKPQCYGSDIHRLLLAAEIGQKADVRTYTSGHLGPRSLNQRQPRAETKRCFWRTSQNLEEIPTPLAPQKRQTKISTCVKKKEEGKYASEFTSGAALVESGIMKSSKDQATDYLSHEGTREDKTLKTDHSSSDSLPLQHKSSPQKPNNSSSDVEGSSQVNSSHSDGMNNTSQHEIKQQFGRAAAACENLCAGASAAETHERKVKQEVKELAAGSRPNRGRLAVCSDVFDDVCEGSPVFGSILREIKTEYGLYTNHLMPSHSAVPKTAQKAAPSGLGALKAKEMELEEALEEVEKLEHEAKSALEENKRARNELENIPATESPEDTLLTCPRDGAGGRSDGVRVRRLQVRSVWREIQQLEEEMKNKMVSADVTTNMERSIKDKKIEIVNLIASNERLRTINKIDR